MRVGDEIFVPREEIPPYVILKLLTKGIQVMTNILWAVIVILLVLWLLGWLVGNVGSFIHLLLVIAVVVLLYNLLVGTRRSI
jgi:predicted membrane metal-binding protein